MNPLRAFIFGLGVYAGAVRNSVLTFLHSVARNISLTRPPAVIHPALTQGELSYFAPPERKRNRVRHIAHRSMILRLYLNYRQHLRRQG